ncbi:ABC transporter permease/M1 family aminopeptidase [Lacihabitans lacunae]|uniref:M1 family aminopeptidase n=1 Tax=Lacihabitans lacunae TaxID=1028214 RepID=A0ABV7YZL0_9BACT
MWINFLKFEFSYRKARPATYVSFFLLFFLAFVFTATPVKEIFLFSEQIKENGTYGIYSLSTIMGTISIFIISFVMGGAILRDFENNMEALFFTTNIKKFDYLFGRFIGSFIVLCLILLSIPLGLMLGQAMPWQEAHRLGPFRLFNYFNPYFFYILSNAFILSAVFFMVGALSRKMIYVFLQALVFFVLNQSLSKLFTKIELEKTLSYMNPLGFEAYFSLVKYWTISQKNVSSIPFRGDFLFNRLIWLFVGVLILMLTYYLFSFKTIINSGKPQSNVATKEKRRFGGAPMPYAYKNFYEHKDKVLGMAQVYFLEVVKSIPFVAFSILMVLIFFVLGNNLKGSYGSGLVPYVSIVLEPLSDIVGTFALVLMIIFVGDLVWRERDVKFNMIQDALPVPSWVILTAKYLGLALAFGVFMGLGILAGVYFQTVRGFFDFQLNLYLQLILGNFYINLLILMFLGFFIHVVVNNKYLGHAIFLAVIFSDFVFSKLGILTPFVKFGSGSLAKYSDMNGFGHSLPLYLCLTVYWLAIAVILFILAAKWMVRGAEESILTRVKTGKTNGFQKTAIGLLTILALGLGGVVYYNTKVLNTYQTEEEDINEQVAFEKDLKKYDNASQPKVVDVKLNMELYPSTRDFFVQGHYWLKNKNEELILEVYVQQNFDNQLLVNALKINVANKLDDKYVKKHGFYIFKLDKPLQNGDSVLLDFEIKHETNGFEKSFGKVQAAENGTFINNSYFPTIGYMSIMELQDPKKRKEKGLKANDWVLKRKGKNGLSRSAFNQGADFVNFEATVGTELDQIAITPGYLQKEWIKNNRRYFSYKMNKPMVNLYSIVSARYEVKRENHNGVNLEVFYHRKHAANIGRMMTAMKNTLDYYQKEFGPYQYSQLRIMEFPRFMTFALSFANTVSYSEIMGFVSKIDDSIDPDFVTFVTAQEVGYQWWGHQNVPADQAGSLMLPESLVEYSALMVMSKNSNALQMENFLKYELKEYLSSRPRELKKEVPLGGFENQANTHCTKGSLVLYAIQDYIGEKKLNQGLKNFLFKFKNGLNQPKPIYLTSKDLVREVRAVMPDSLSYLVTDLFQKITLYNFQTNKASQKSLNGGYEVSLDISAEKLYADEIGKESPQKFNEWIWVGLYGENRGGKENLIYYKRHKIKEGQQNIKVWVKEKPKKGGIDPLLIMIDKVPSDNILDID